MFPRAAGGLTNFRLPIFDWRLNIARCDEICRTQRAISSAAIRFDFAEPCCSSPALAWRGGTSGCCEDCAYCAQSAHYSTGVEREDLLSREVVMAAASRARSQGATRFCMGTSWRGVHVGSEKFERVLEIVREVSRLGMEVCVTLGEIGPAEARKLKAAGVTAYNHNITK